MAINVPGGILKQTDVRETITNTEEVGVGWNMDYARYEGRFNTNLAGQEFGLFISADGYHVYICNIEGGVGAIYQYLMGTPWDISTVTSVRNLDISAKETQPLGVYFKVDGTKMYTIGQAGDSIDEYNLSIPWDISTALYSQEFDASIETNPQALYFREDGKQMFFGGQPNDKIYSLNLSTPWDVSTAETVGEITIGVAVRDMWFSRDGTYVFWCSGTSSVIRWKMTTVFDISTATADTTFANTPVEGVDGIAFKQNGVKMYLLTGGYIAEYTIKRGWRT